MEGIEMFESFSIIVLQQYWWIIVSLLAGFLVFLTFIQGGQTLLYKLGKTESEQKILINTFGRKWEFTFTTLVTFGGAFFASFPLFYSTSFGGAYWVWIAILLCFVIQAVSYEYRNKPANLLGNRTYDTFLIINGVLGTVLLGSAVATFFTGSEFTVNKDNISNLSNPVISQWQTPYHGLEALIDFQNLSLGIAVFYLARVLALLYVMANVADKNIFARAKHCLLFNTIFFLAFFLFFFIRLMLIDGFSYDSSTGIIFIEANKYWYNILEMPVNTVLLGIGVLSLLFGIIKSIFWEYTNGIWFAGIGTVLVVFSLFLLAGFNHTAYYPSTWDLQSSLTIENSSSSRFTLSVMSYVSLSVPFVFLYLFYAWRVMNKKKIDLEEIEHDKHSY